MIRKMENYIKRQNKFINSNSLFLSSKKQRSHTHRQHHAAALLQRTTASEKRNNEHQQTDNDQQDRRRPETGAHKVRIMMVGRLNDSADGQNGQSS